MDHSRKFPTFSTSKSSVKNLWFWTWLRFKSRRLSMCRPSGRICSLSPWKTEIIGPLRCILFCWLWLIWMSTESALSLLHGLSKECAGAGRSKTHWPPVGILISLSATQPRQAWKCLCVKYSKVQNAKTRVPGNEMWRACVFGFVIMAGLLLPIVLLSHALLSWYASLLPEFLPWTKRVK